MKKPDVPCADCGKLLITTKGSLPAGKRRCHPCRRLRKPPCPKCGGQMSPGSAGKTPCRGCSPRAVVVPRACAICRKEYRTDKVEQKTCGRICGAAYRNRAVEPKVKSTALDWTSCPFCNAWVAKPDRMLCGAPDCRRSYMRSAYRARFVSQARPVTVACRECAEDYSTKTASNGGVCKRCQLRINKARFGSSDRKRARYYGVAYEPVDRLKVYERDGWICGLCDEPVMRGERSPHPLSPSLDHIVPISRGGDHLYGNVQCAHFLCNSLKGDRINEAA